MCRENLMSVQFERDQTWNGARAKRAENPGAHRHGRSMFKNAQHVKEETRTAEIHDQQNWRKDRSGDGSDPHGRARKIDMMKDDRAARDHGGHSGHSAEEKIKRNFPRPDRGFDHGLTIVTWFTRDRATGNVHAFAGSDAFLPRLFAQLFKSLFGWQIGLS